MYATRVVTADLFWSGQHRSLESNWEGMDAIKFVGISFRHSGFLAKVSKSVMGLSEPAKQISENAALDFLHVLFVRTQSRGSRRSQAWGFLLENRLVSSHFHLWAFGQLLKLKQAFDVPSSFASAQFNLQATGTNQFLVNGQIHPFLLENPTKLNPATMNAHVDGSVLRLP